MSGGSYDYLYARVENAAGSIICRSAPETSLVRAAFAKHLMLVARALHEIEWVDSGDSSPGGEVEAIRDCLAPGAELETATTIAERAARELEQVLARARG